MEFKSKAFFFAEVTGVTTVLHAGRGPWGSVCLNKAFGLGPAQPPGCWARGQSGRLCKDYGVDFLVAVMMGTMMAMVKTTTMMVTKVMTKTVRVTAMVT